MMAKRHLFRRGFGMEIDDDRINILAKPVFGKKFVRALERARKRVHEQPPHHVNNANFFARTGFENIIALARCPVGEVPRAQQFFIFIDIGNDFALVPDMVARRQNIGTGIIEFLADFRRHTKTVRRIFHIHHGNIDRKTVPQHR